MSHTVDQSGAERTTLGNGVLAPATLTTSRVPVATAGRTLADSHFEDATSGSFKLAWSVTWTANRTRTLVDLDGTEMLLEAAQTVSGAKTFSAQTTVQDGSASAPSVTRAGTADGLHFGSGFVAIDTGGAERLRVDSTGRLIIGNTAALSIGGQSTPNISQYGTNTAAGQNVLRSIADANPVSWNIAKSRNPTPGSFTVGVDGDQVHAFNWCTDDGASYNTKGAQLLATVTGAPAVGNAPVRLDFLTGRADTGALVASLRISPMGTARTAVVLGSSLSSSTGTPLTTHSGGASSSTQACAQLISVANSAHLALTQFNAGSSTAPILTFAHALVSTYATYTALASGNLIGEIRSDGADGTTFRLSARYITSVDGTVSAGIVPGRHQWYTTDTSGASNEGLRLNSARQLVTNGASAPAANAFAGHILYGVTDATAALTGQIGESVESKISTPTNAAATTAYLALTSISLTAGDWDITGVAELASNGATFATANADMVVGTTSASATGSTVGYDRVRIPSLILGATGIESGTVGRKRLQITATTTVYLNVVAAYSLGTPQWTGSLSARRIR